MLFSLAVAFVVTPWAAYRLFQHETTTHDHGEEGPEGWSTRLYRTVMGGLIESPLKRWGFFAVMVGVQLVVTYVPWLTTWPHYFIR